MRILAALTIGLTMAGLAIAQQQQPRLRPVAPGAPIAPGAPVAPVAPVVKGLAFRPQSLPQRFVTPSTPGTPGSPATVMRQYTAPYGRTESSVFRFAPRQIVSGSAVWDSHALQNTELQKKSAEATQRMSKATELLKSESEDDRVQAKTDLTVALTDLFEVMTDSREEQIEDLEKRLTKMREQLEERNAEKQQIVNLRLQTIVNEANGLTF